VVILFELGRVDLWENFPLGVNLILQCFNLINNLINNIVMINKDKKIHSTGPKMKVELFSLEHKALHQVSVEAFIGFIFLPPTPHTPRGTQDHMPFFNTLNLQDFANSVPYFCSTLPSELVSYSPFLIFLCVPNLP